MTLTLVSGTTHINLLNPSNGKSANLLITTATGCTASFSSNVKQEFNNTYLPSSGSSKVDVLSFIAFDSTNVYLAPIKNLV